MSILDALANVHEPERLDYVIKEHEKLDRKFVALVDLLFEKKVITKDESVRLRIQQPI